MRVFSEEVFDDIISGTDDIWYSGDQFDLPLGISDFLAIQAVTSAVSGADPKLTVQVEHSSDDQNWVEVSGTPEINNVEIDNDESFTGGQSAAWVR